MIKFTGWAKDYEQNKDVYDKIFEESMLQEDIENIDAFEDKMKEVSGRKYAVACNSATDALQFSLQCNGIGEGDEVLVTNFSWVSSASCISLVGATPVFCDIDLDTYHMSMDSIKRMTTSKTKAIVYTHLFGSMSDISELLHYCAFHNILFIEDAAQSLGSSLDGVKAGSIGNCSSYSFNSNKVIAGISGGGVFLTDDVNMARYVEKLRRHGKAEDFSLLGHNSKTSVMLLNANIITYRVSKMKEHQERRQDIADLYDEVFEDLGITVQRTHGGLDHNYHKYIIRVKNRKPIMNALRRNNIQTSIHYDQPISENSMYKHITHRADDYPNTKEVCGTIMSLPIHAWMTDEEVDQVINVVWANA